jgi:hypothetical protein
MHDLAALLEELGGAHLIGLGRDSAGVASWTSRFTDRDWASAEASRHEAWAGDAPVNFGRLVQASYPKVVVVGGWPGDHRARACSHGSGPRAHRAGSGILTRGLATCASAKLRLDMNGLVAGSIRRGGSN